MTTPTDLIPACSEAAEVVKPDIYFVRNAVARVEAKTGDKLDIYNGQTQELILTSREENTGALMKLARFMGGDADRAAAFNYTVRSVATGGCVLGVQRGSSTLSMGGAAVKFLDGAQQPIAVMKRQLLTLGRKYNFSRHGQILFTLELKKRWGTGDLYINRQQVATLSRKWEGENADFFKQGFDFALSFAPEHTRDSTTRLLILGFALAWRRIAQNG